MSFGLKNPRSMYKRVITHMFKDYIGKFMEVYIDGMFVKSVQEDNHIKYLKESFEVIRITT